VTSLATQERVRATPAALDLIELLEERHGPLAFFQAEGCRDGTAAICLTKGELLPSLSPSDLRLGRIGGAPFYVDAEQYEGWHRPELLIDVAAGPAGSFSLEGLERIHFVTRSPRDDS
jgi:uncharacterized protein (DUF779 family)